ncbi:MAG: hypothetical protein ABJD07_02835 [Gemmatimonadaceae bacterium]
MSNLPPAPPTPRREFLGQLATAAVALAGTACANTVAATQSATQAAAPAPRVPRPPQHFDDAWVKRLTAPHKAVFDSPDIEDGLAIGQAYLYMQGYHTVYQTPDSDIQAVIVMRHKGVPMAFGDELWDKYEIGKMIKLKDDKTGKWMRRNPFYKADPADKNAWPEGTLSALSARGAILVACNLAAMGMAGRMAAAVKADADAVRDEVRAGLVPGVTLAPSGVFATLRAQEAGCVFLRSS